MIALTISYGMPYFITASFIFLRFIVSNAFEKAMKRIVSGIFTYFTPSNIHLIVIICPVVDLFLWKPFWFRLKIGSISDLILFNNINLYILADIAVSVIPL